MPTHVAPDCLRTPSHVLFATSRHGPGINAFAGKARYVLRDPPCTCVLVFVCVVAATPCCDTNTLVLHARVHASACASTCTRARVRARTPQRCLAYPLDAGHTPCVPVVAAPCHDALDFTTELAYRDRRLLSCRFYTLPFEPECPPPPPPEPECPPPPPPEPECPPPPPPTCHECLPCIDCKPDAVPAQPRVIGGTAYAPPSGASGTAPYFPDYKLNPDFGSASTSNIHRKLFDICSAISLLLATILCFF
ncbi:hypothetical protein SLEP1_g32002 [Rubroshorea leprosula]|uniref:Uncharacterized protein n=1 Tax=Rubroshorea leprosula TaxID=152421 RepID=A0AAV5KC20_9ROSI|nr:hypothetical protein SLEP1_g32002 [Rubroshorea leprosula]